MISRREYNNIHYYLRSNFGKANKCESIDCPGTSKHYEWALKKGREYSRNPNDYFHFCKSCHSKYDGYKLTESGRKKLSKSAKFRFTGTEPANKGNDSRLEKTCKYCACKYTAYAGKRKTYCSVDCRNNDMIGKPSRNKKT